MKKSLVVLIVLVVVAGVAAAIVLTRDDNNETETNQSATSQTQSTEQSIEVEQTQENGVQSGEVSVSITNFEFPDTLKITKGTKVTWTNQDTAEHNVVSDEDSPAQGLNGPLLAKGESFSFTFEEAGTYNYHCTPHPFMTGVVEVTE